VIIKLKEIFPNKTPKEILKEIHETQKKDEEK